jgi:hypothetical protein
MRHGLITSAILSWAQHLDVDIVSNFKVYSPFAVQTPGFETVSKNSYFYALGKAAAFVLFASDPSSAE